MLKVASLFSGCGGADLGIVGGFKFLSQTYDANDVTVVHASDIDSDAVFTYNQNFSHKAVTADVNELSFNDGFCDVLVGGFPCQSFSTVNPNKDPEDDRGQLYKQLVRLARESNPSIVIGENVKGFYRLRGGLYFRKFEAELLEAGYRVYHKILRAHDFGVPQKRERLFVVAVRNDIKGEFEFPKSTALDKFGNESFTPLGSVITNLADVPSKYYFSERAVAGVKAAKPNMKRALAQDLSQPCLTVTSHLAKVSLNSRDPVLLVDPEKELYRRFTPSEAASIQGFPIDFKWPEVESKAYRQIGNAISPIVMWHLFQAVSNFLQNQELSLKSSPVRFVNEGRGRPLALPHVPSARLARTLRRETSKEGG
jgi:DNA (cytosine-5)-methyltransferase 1